jgi:hypothetical protein
MKMAYSPTTWNTNDVITKDKLNKIEQGVKTATRLSGTDIDADKNWNGKSITNMKALTLTESSTRLLMILPHKQYHVLAISIQRSTVKQRHNGVDQSTSVATGSDSDRLTLTGSLLQRSRPQCGATLRQSRGCWTSGRPVTNTLIVVVGAGEIICLSRGV